MGTASERARFLWAFLRHPREVGSVVPSSRYLAAAVVRPVPRDARCVGEFGPGTGPITRALLAHLSGVQSASCPCPAWAPEVQSEEAGGSHSGAALGEEAVVLAMEIDPAFCALLRREIPDPRLRVNQAPAQELGRYAAEVGRPVEAIVSGLPFANFPVALRREIVQAAYDALAPGGVFSGYGYAPFALPPLLREVFGNCRLGFVWRNVPPAFVCVAKK